MTLSYFPKLEQRITELRSKSEKTKLEIHEFEFLSYLESMLSCIDAFDKNRREFSRAVDRFNFQEILRKSYENFENNENWITNKDG